MENKEKLDVVLQAIIKARKDFPDLCVQLSRKKDSDLDKLTDSDIRDILSKLEFTEKVIKRYPQKPNPKMREGSILPEKDALRNNAVTPTPSRGIRIPVIDPKTGRQAQPKPIWASKKDLATIKIFPTFDNWYQAYLIRRNRKLSDLTQVNLEKILSMVLDIDDKLQMVARTDVFIDAVSNHHFALLDGHIHSQLDNIEYRNEALEYLLQEDITKDYKYKPSQYGKSCYEIHLNIQHFLRFKDEIKSFYRSKYTQTFDMIELPSNTEWQDITIKFLNGHDVLIKAKELEIESNFEKMGFKDKKTRLPNKQWEFLHIMARNNGQITWNDSDASNKHAKNKERLSKLLKAFFNIEDSPFLPYDKQTGYKAKFTLLPE